MQAEVIVEIGHNHNGNIRLAKEMIKEVADCGAKIAKMQYYKIDTIKKPYQSRYFELWAAQLHKEDLAELHECAKENDVEFMLSIFSHDLVKDVLPYVDRFKIASRSIYDVKLWAEMQKANKPIIASLGKWKEDYLPKHQASYLYCVSDYPAKIESLPSFNKYDGFSDHSIGLEWCKKAIDSGAKIIEKHFTLSRDLPGYNQLGSINPTELKDLIKYAK